MARIELSNIGGGGGTTLSLTTTGTSGASTLAGSVLNIPVYQGQLTLTTTGTSGAATLVGNTLNIPQYSGGGGTPAGSAGQVQFNSTPAGSFAASANLAWVNSPNPQLNIGAPSAPTARLNVRGGGSSSATATQVWTNSGNTELMRLRDDGNLGIGTSTPSRQLTVFGTGSTAAGRTTMRIQNSAPALDGAASMELFNANGSYAGLQFAGSAWPGGQTLSVFTAQDINISFFTNGDFATGGTAPIQFIVGGYNNSPICQFRSTGINIGHTATTPGARLHVVGANTTAGAGALLVQDGAGTPSTIYRIDNDGKVTYRATNTAAGTTGAQTINRPSGTVNFAAGASALVVTNSLCTTASIVFATVRTNDATAYIKNVVPAAGSFTINLGAAATAETSVGFFIIN